MRPSLIRTLHHTARTMATSTVKSDPASYIFNHTMIRIKDPKIEVPWFENVLGFEVSDLSLQPRPRRPLSSLHIYIPHLRSYLRFQCFRKADGPDFTNFLCVSAGEH